VGSVKPLRSFQSRVVISFLILITLVQVGTVVAVDMAIQRSARAHVKAELATAAKLIGRLLDVRTEQLVHAARILSADFPFKQVVALDDRATLLSALDNHRMRIDAALAMLVSLDGRQAVGTLPRQAAASGPITHEAVPRLIDAARRSGEVSDFLVVEGRAYQVVLVPLLAPAPIAWIGMGFPLDQSLADRLEKAIAARISFIIGDAAPPTPTTDVETLVTTLPSVTGTRISVVLQRSLAEAMAPFRLLRAALLVLVGVGAVVSIVGGIWIARGVSRPVRQLAEAARKIEAGQYGAAVPLTRQDELGDLAATFNRMTGAVAEREERLRDSEERFRAMTESAVDAVVTTDDGGHVVSWNRGAQAIFGYSAEETLGMALTRVLPDFSTDGAQRAITKDGREIPVELTLATWQSRRRTFQTAIIRDVTERLQLEDQVRQSQKMESVGRLAGGVAHDFNNLLTIIGGHVDLVEADLHATLGPDNPLQRRIQVIRSATTHAADLTRQLLAFSRKQVLAPRIVDLNTIVAEVEPMLRRLIGEHIELVTLGTRGLGRVEADPSQITQIILNLAANARDAMPEGGKLTIETANVHLDEDHTHRHPDARPGAYVMLAVVDTGSGMDEPTRERLFEPFFTTKGPGKGTGLGLATVYGIVRQSNGNIGVDSAPGCGTTFRIYLPEVTEATA
jgi:signal transduction histidine kinase